MNFFNNVSLLTIIAIGYINIDGKTRKFDGSTVTELAFHVKDDRYATSTTRTIRDIKETTDYKRLIEAVRLPNSAIYFKIETLPTTLTDKQIQHFGQVLDTFLTRTGQFATRAVFEQGEMQWSTYCLTKGIDGKWQIKILGDTQIQHIVTVENEEFYMVQAQGRLATIDTDKLVDLVATNSFNFTAQIVKSGVVVKPGMSLMRPSDKLGVMLTDGKTAVRYDRKLQEIGEGEGEISTMFLAAIDVDGKVEDDQFVIPARKDGIDTIDRVPFATLSQQPLFSQQGAPANK